MIGDPNVIYGLVQNTWFHMRDGGDWFPRKPLVCSSSIDLGTVGSTSLVHWQGTLGALFNGWEVFGGYDYLRFGSVDTHGPIACVRLWF